MAQKGAFGVFDGDYPITSLYSPTEGLAQQQKDIQVITTAPGITGSFSQWHLTRIGTTLDGTSLLGFFELLDSGNNSTGYFLSYDYAKSSVVIKSDSRDVWVISQDKGGQNQYRIKLPFQDANGKDQYLTYNGSNAQVIVTAEDSGNDAPKQVWNIAA